MNNISKLYDESENLSAFAKGYFTYLSELLEGLDTDAIASVAREFEESRQNNQTIFIVGNGGSASTASHMANDFGGDIQRKTGTCLPFRTLALTDNAALTMAIANDDGYENVFVRQLCIYYRPGDKLLAISASGNSPNVVAAAKWVKEQGGTVMSLVGFDGGDLKALSDQTIHVKTPKGEYGPVEDIHMIMDHVIANWLQYKVAREEDCR